MKKLIAIFFLVIYSLTTVDATMHSHYCMGEYMGSSLYHSKDNKCEKCGITKVKSKGCCKDEHKYVSLKREHNQIKTLIEVPNFFVQTILPTYITYNIVAVTYTTTTAKTIIHSPPLIYKQRLHIINCIYLI